MVKPKLNRQGFTLIEVLIVLVVISFTLLINLQISNNAFKSDLYLKEMDILKAQINTAKQVAINTKSLVNIKFHTNTLEIISVNNSSKIFFKSIYFDTSKELYYNRNGVLNHGYTLLFKHGYKYHKLIFYVGKGWFKIV